MLLFVRVRLLSVLTLEKLSLTDYKVCRKRKANAHS
jgi:hypothetical protein